MNSVTKRLCAFLCAMSLVAPVAVQATDDNPVAPVVEGFWQELQENSGAIFNNIWNAGATVLSYVPGTLVQLSKEVRILSEVLPQCPFMSFAVLSAAAYGSFKLYNKLSKNDQLRERIVHLIHQRGNNDQQGQ